MRKPEQKINGMPQFHGPFRELIPDYITYKRSQGYKYREPVVYHLREMDLFFMEMGIQDIRITREMYEAYTKPHPPEKETTTQKRQQTIRGFAKYLVFLGYTDIYTGYDDTRIFKRDFIPYIFSKEEIKRMFGVLDRSCVESPCYENDAFRILMLLYYCCGLRKAEAQELKLGDINFEKGKITILHGKNDVARIIPVSDSLLAQLRLHRKTTWRILRGKISFSSGKRNGPLLPALYTGSSTASFPKPLFHPGQMGDGSACMTCAILFA